MNRTTVPLLRALRLQVLLRGIDRRERIAVATAFAAVILMLFAALASVSRNATIYMAPLGSSDALGHPRLLKELQDRLEKFPDNHSLQYLTAVVAHYGGETETAVTLYRRAGGRKASENLAALAAHRLPARPLSDADWGAALADSWRMRLQSLRVEGDPLFSTFSSMLAPVLAVSIALTLVILLGRGTCRPPAAKVDSKLMRALMLVVPGMWDARRGSMLRAMLIVFGIGVWILPLLYLRKRDVFVVGPFSFGATTDVLSAYPVPDAQHGLRPLMIDAALADPRVVAFLAVIALLGAASVVLHVSRFPRILRRSGTDVADQPTAIAPATN